MSDLAAAMSPDPPSAAPAAATPAPPAPPATPSPPAGPVGSASVAPQGSAPVAGSPALTVDGTTVRIVGLGNGVSPDFDLPAGSAAMTVSLCANQVIPFVTLFDAAGMKLAIIVEPEYEIKNLVGGMYRIEVQSNPACVWTVEVTPA